MPEIRQKLVTRVDSRLLAQLRRLAKQEGRQIQALVDEALADLIEKRDRTKPRDHVMAAFHASHERYASLYEKLAK